MVDRDSSPHRSLGSFGVWCPELRTRDQRKAEEIAAGIEELGFSILWIPGGTGGPLFEHVTTVLGATRKLPVATAVTNMIMHDPADAAGWFTAMEREHPGRLILGLGASNAQRAEAIGVPYRPMSRTTEYLDRLDEAGVPASRRLLGALGPRMLEVARDRALGAHTYVVDPGHTRRARRVLGPDRLLCPVVKVAAESDVQAAFAAARANLVPYMGMATYRRSLLSMGYTEKDLSDGGSEQMISALVVLDGVAAALARAREHLDAGADHVCFQVVTADRRDVPWETWNELASAVTLSSGSSAGSTS